MWAGAQAAIAGSGGLASRSRVRPTAYPAPRSSWTSQSARPTVLAGSSVSAKGTPKARPPRPAAATQCGVGAAATWGTWCDPFPRPPSSSDFPARTASPFPCFFFVSRYFIVLRRNLIPRVVPHRHGRGFPASGTPGWRLVDAAQAPARPSLLTPGGAGRRERRRRRGSLARRLPYPRGQAPSDGLPRGGCSPVRPVCGGCVIRGQPLVGLPSHPSHRIRIGTRSPGSYPPCASGPGCWAGYCASR